MILRRGGEIWTKRRKKSRPNAPGNECSPAFGALVGQQPRWPLPRRTLCQLRHRAAPGARPPSATLATQPQPPARSARQGEHSLPCLARSGAAALHRPPIAVVCQRQAPGPGPGRAPLAARAELGLPAGAPRWRLDAAAAEGCRARAWGGGGGPAHANRIEKPIAMHARETQGLKRSPVCARGGGRRG